jgi:hypothetical protein
MASVVTSVMNFLVHTDRNLPTVCSRFRSVMIVITFRIETKGIGFPFFLFFCTCTNYLFLAFQNSYGTHLDPIPLRILGWGCGASTGACTGDTPNNFTFRVPHLRASVASIVKQVIHCELKEQQLFGPPT